MPRSIQHIVENVVFNSHILRQLSPRAHPIYTYCNQTTIGTMKCVVFAILALALASAVYGNIRTLTMLKILCVHSTKLDATV